MAFFKALFAPAGSDLSARGGRCHKTWAEDMVTRGGAAR